MTITLQATGVQRLGPRATGQVIRWMGPALTSRPAPLTGPEPGQAVACRRASCRRAARLTLVLTTRDQAGHERLCVPHAVDLATRRHRSVLFGYGADVAEDDASGAARQLLDLAALDAVVLEPTPGNLVGPGSHPYAAEIVTGVHFSRRFAWFRTRRARAAWVKSHAALPLGNPDRVHMFLGNHYADTTTVLGRLVPTRVRERL
jgi:hypothetical protein